MSTPSNIEIGPEPLLHQLHNPRHIAAVALVGLSSLWLRNSYLEFKSLGPGGPPYNVKGWLAVLLLKLFARETKGTKEYELDGNKESYLDGELPQRAGERPKTPFHVAPARQRDQIPSKDVMEKLDALFKRIVDANPTLLKFDTSPHESLHNGIMLHPSRPAPHAVAAQALREVAHIHPSDHSLHVLLAPLDCKHVIERGWGERHQLSGSKTMHALPFPPNAKLPKEYIWIYAPRDGEEIAVVEKILLAAVRFMAGTREVSH